MVWHKISSSFIPFFTEVEAGTGNAKMINCFLKNLLCSYCKNQNSGNINLLLQTHLWLLIIFRIESVSLALDIRLSLLCPLTSHHTAAQVFTSVIPNTEIHYPCTPDWAVPLFSNLAYFYSFFLKYYSLSSLLG